MSINYQKAAEKNVRTLTAYVDDDNYLCADAAKTQKLTCAEVSNAFTKSMLVIAYDNKLYVPCELSIVSDYAKVAFVIPGSEYSKLECTSAEYTAA